MNVELARRMTEAQFQRAVIDRARLLGWRVWHFHDSRREIRRGNVSRLVGDGDAKGWPDLALAHLRHGFMVRELKKHGGRVTAAQRDALAALIAAGVDAGVWRPLDMQRIEYELAGGTRRGREAA